MGLEEELEPERGTRGTCSSLLKQRDNFKLLLPFALDTSGHWVGIFSLQAPSQDLSTFVVQKTGRNFPKSFH